MSDSGAQGNGASFAPSISADGRYVAFRSDASDLVTGDTNCTGDVFLRDVRTGRTTLISESRNGAGGNGRNDAPSISADGRHGAFSSEASNLVPGDINGAPDVFIRDVGTDRIRLASVSSSGTQGSGSVSEAPSVNADGRYVTFASNSGDLVPGRRWRHYRDLSPRPHRRRYPTLHHCRRPRRRVQLLCHQPVTCGHERRQ